MPTKVVYESRKSSGADESSSGNGRGSASKSGDGKMQLVSQEIMRLVDASRDGRLSERGRPDQFDGVYREIVQGVNEMLDAILLPIGEGNRILGQVSNGKIDELIAQTYKGDHEKMKQAVNNVAIVVQSLQKEMARLTDASKDGQLSDRGKPEQFQGAYAEIVRGVNVMLDAILLPIGEGNRILAQISNGKIDELIAQTYKGDHEKMKKAINNIAVVLQGLQKEMARLTDASKDGQLSDRGKPEQFQGAYAEIVRGVNTMLDAILLPIGEGNRILGQVSNGKIDELIAQTYKGDHEKMKQAINSIAVVLQGLQKEMARLTDASKEGQLSDRGKPEQFQGAYAEIVRGVNVMLDAILLPIGEGNRILGQVSNGKIDELIAQTYKGDHEKMKQAINNIAIVLQGLQKEMARLTDASNAGQFSDRGKQDQFRGAYCGDRARCELHPRRRHHSLKFTAGYIDRISKGDLPPTITDTYHGDFNLIKDNLNTLIAAMSEITNAADEMANGNLTVTLRERSPQDKLMQALERHGGRHYAGGIGHPLDCRRGGVGQPGHQHDIGRGLEGRQFAGGVGRGSVVVDGGDGFEHQAECRQRAADRQDRQQVGSGRAGKRQVGGGGGGGDERNRQPGLDHRGDRPPDQPAGPERGHRSGARRGTRQRICRGRRRSPQARRAQPEGGGRDQPALGHHRKGLGDERAKCSQKLVPDIQRTAELVQEIAAASKEQDTGAEQINKALVQLEKVIQQNASASEEMASTTEELTSQSEQLVSALGFFRTGDDGHVAYVRSAAAKPARHVEAAPARTAKPAGHAAPPKAMAAKAGAGVNLKLKDKDKEKADDLDKEFERF